MQGTGLTVALAAGALLAGCGLADPGSGGSASTSTPSVTQSVPSSTSQPSRMPGTTHSRTRHTPDVGVPNGFYIVNQNPRLRTLPVQRGAVVSVLVPMHGSTHQTIRIAALPKHLANDLDPDDAKLWHNPFWLTVHNDRIVSIVEQYTP